jgi:hypothetical protein
VNVGVDRGVTVMLYILHHTFAEYGIGYLVKVSGRDGKLLPMSRRTEQAWQFSCMPSVGSLTWSDRNYTRDRDPGNCNQDHELRHHFSSAAYFSFFLASHYCE